MSLLELGTAAVVGTQLLDAKYHIKDDFLLAQMVVKAAIKSKIREFRGKSSYWYFFEDSVAKYANNKAIAFPRPKANPPPVRNDADGYPNYDDQFTLEEYSYKELYDMILRFSYILKYDFGVTAADTVAIDCMNKPLFVVVWFALWNIGAIPSFLNFNTKDKALVHCLKIANIKHVIIDPDCSGPIRGTESAIKSEIPDSKLHYINEPELFKVLSNPSKPKYRAPDETRRPDDKHFSCAALIYTSGTTGLPKSAIISWRKCYMAASPFGYIMKVNKSSNVLTAMPLYHSTAALLGVLPALLSGSCVSISQKFSASTFWTQAKLTGSTHIQYVGEVCRYLVNSKYHPDEKKHNVRIAYGNGLRRDIWRTFKSRFHIEGVGEFYASTESPTATTNLQYGEYGIGAVRKYGALVTLILRQQQVIVKMDPEDENELYRDPVTGFCKEAEKGESGELLIRLLNASKPEETFQGYYGNNKATSSKLITNVFKNSDAYFRSGDLLKEDEDGLFYFVDRLGDTFRWKSENVSATEVENELMGSGVAKQSVVVGVRVPNHEGRAGFAVIEPIDEFGDSDKHKELLKKLYDYIKDSLPKYAQPQFIKIISKIESSHNHKVPKNTYKKQVLPKGDDGKEVIYWLNGNGYEELTNESWGQISSGSSKL